MSYASIRLFESIMEAGLKHRDRLLRVPVLGSLARGTFKLLRAHVAGTGLSDAEIAAFGATRVTGAVPTDRSLNRLCDLADWSEPALARIVAELGGDQSRKWWETGVAFLGLERLGAVREDAVGLSVGAGHEVLLYYLANRVLKVIGTDLYDGSAWEDEGNPDALLDPARFAPFDYRRSHLELRRMSGCSLELPSDMFDFAYSLSSIEHFGGHAAAAQSMREIARTLKPGGVAAIVTEFKVDGKPHREFFNRPDLEEHMIRSHGMELVLGPLDLRISEATLATTIDLERDHIHRRPHIVLRHHGHDWTSIALFFRKAR